MMKLILLLACILFVACSEYDRSGTNCEQYFANCGGGGSKFSELELALAKKCSHLYERVEVLNEERNKFREALKSVYITCDKADGDNFREERKKNLECTAKGLFKQMLKLNAEKENINGTPTATEDVHAQTNP